MQYISKNYYTISYYITIAIEWKLITQIYYNSQLLINSNYVMENNLLLYQEY